MEFTYKAKGTSKKAGKGRISARDRKDALRKLDRAGVAVTDLRAVRERKAVSFGKVSALQKVSFTRHLAVMLQAGISLDKAIGILGSQAKGRMGPVLEEGRASVQSGETLSDALAAHPKVFNDYFVSMVQAGEKSGKLAENLTLLGERFAKDLELQKKARSAMVYPAIVLMLTVGLGIVIAAFVLPRLSGLFRSFRFELPLSTRILIQVSNFLNEWGIIAGIVSLVLFVLVIWLARQRFAAPVVHRIYARLPIIRTITRDINLARFATVFGTLLESGMPINAALAVTADVLGNHAYRAGLHKALAAVEKGEKLGTSLEKDSLYPPFVTQLIAVGEETGRLQEVLTHISEFYENELDDQLKNLATILEPAMLLVIGFIVAFIAFAIITPIYGFIGAVS